MGWSVLIRKQVVQLHFCHVDELAGKHYTLVNTRLDNRIFVEQVAVCLLQTIATMGTKTLWLDDFVQKAEWMDVQPVYDMPRILVYKRNMKVSHQ